MSAPLPPPRPRHRLWRELLGVGMSLLMVVLGEVGLRCYERIKTGSWNLPPYLDETNKLNCLNVRAAYPPYRLWPEKKLYGEGGRVVVSINSLGYRGADVIPGPKKRGAIRVICYGASSTFGYLLGNDDETWPAQLGVALRQQGYEAEVINAGVPGYTIFYSLLDYIGCGQHLNPDVIVLCQGWNDIRRSYVEPDNPFDENGTDPPTVRQRRTPPWWRRSFLFLKMKSWSQSSTAVRTERKTGRPEAIEQPNREKIARDERYLLEFALIGRNHGTIVVFIPEMMAMEHPKAEGDGGLKGLGWTRAAIETTRQAYRLGMRQAGQETGAMVWEFENEIPGTAENFYDEGHMTPTGSRRFGEALARRLAPVLKNRHSTDKP